jgi:hypothetical protein
MSKIRFASRCCSTSIALRMAATRVVERRVRTIPSD